MATRFYLPSTGAAAVDPAWSTSWTDATTASASKLRAITSKISSADATKTINDADSADQHYACGMWVSDPIGAQTIAAQTVTVSVKCSQTDAKNNMFLHWIVRVLKPDNTYRGTLVAFQADGTEPELTAAIASRGDTATSSEVVCLANDRIVIELGLGGDPTTTSQHDSNLVIGDSNGSDLTLANGDTTGDPWLDFGTTTINFTTTLAVADGAHAQTADAVSLTQHNVLAVVAATHAHVADAPVLAQHYAALAVAACAHGHAADALVLTAYDPVSALTVSNPAHAHTADNLALIQHNILSAWQPITPVYHAP